MPGRPCAARTPPRAALSWYIVHCRPHCDRMARDALERRGFAAYLPMETRYVRHARRRREAVARPLFGRYLFVALDPAAPRFADVRRSIGVEWIMSHASGAPIGIDARLVEAIRQAEEAGAFDRTATMAKAIPVKPGDAVRIADGPFQGVIAEIVAAPSQRRIEILLHLPMRAKVVMPLAKLERIG